MGEYAFDAGHESEITGSDLRNLLTKFIGNVLCRLSQYLDAP